jgi:hypothetical protein
MQLDLGVDGEEQPLEERIYLTKQAFDLISLPK